MVQGKGVNLFKDNIYRYLAEAAGLCLFMISACMFTALFEYPGTGLRYTIASDFVRRIPMGFAMGLTAYAIIISPLGKISGSHINPAISIVRFRLGELSFTDTVFYIVFQFAGGLTGVLISAFLLGSIIQNTHVNYAVTIPGAKGFAGAIAGEVIIAAIMIAMVLVTSNHKKWKATTPLLAGILIMLNVVFEAPYSGFGMNPARTVASAWPAGVWTGIWIYICVPVVTMLLVAEVFLFFRRK